VCKLQLAAITQFIHRFISNVKSIVRVNSSCSAFASDAGDAKSYLESTPWFIPSASPVLSRLTSSFTCQLISVITTTLIIHHSFTPGSKPTFSTNPSHLNTSSTWTAFTITGPDRTYHASWSIFSSLDWKSRILELWLRPGPPRGGGSRGKCPGARGS